MKPYVPSGRADPGAMTRVVVICGLAGVVVGVVAHLVGGQLLHPLLLPLLSGAAAGAVARLALLHWRVRSRRLAACCGLLAGMVTPLVDPVVGFLAEREAIAQALAPAAARLPRAQRDTLDLAVDRALVLGLDTTRLRLDTRLATALVTGERIALEGDRRLDAHAAPGALAVVGSWLRRRVATPGPLAARPDPLLVFLLLLRLLLAGAAGASIAGAAGASPFCERCGEWLPSRGDRVDLGGEDLLAEVRRALARDDAAALASLASGASSTTDPMLRLKARACPRCPDPPWFVELELHTRATNELVVIDEGLTTREVLAPCFAAAARKTTG